MLEIISSVIAYNELKYTPPQSMSNAQYYSAPLKLKADLILTSQNRYPTEQVKSYQLDSLGYASDIMVLQLPALIDL